MGKFSIGNGPPQLPPASTTPTGAPRTAQTRVKPAAGAVVQSAIDAAETSSAEHRPNTEGLRYQVKAGMMKLEQAYYGNDGSESSLLKLMAPQSGPEVIADHVLMRQTRLFAKDLGLTPEESRTLVADLAAVLV